MGVFDTAYYTKYLQAKDKIKQIRSLVESDPNLNCNSVLDELESYLDSVTDSLIDACSSAYKTATDLVQCIAKEFDGIDVQSELLKKAQDLLTSGSPVSNLDKLNSKLQEISEANNPCDALNSNSEYLNSLIEEIGNIASKLSSVLGGVKDLISDIINVIKEVSNFLNCLSAVQQDALSASSIFNESAHQIYQETLNVPKDVKDKASYVVNKTLSPKEKFQDYLNDLQEIV